MGKLREWNRSRNFQRNLLVMGTAFLVLWEFAVPIAAWNAFSAAVSREAAASAAEKLEQILEGASAGRPVRSVRITEAEANSYLYYEMAPELPPGISNIEVKFTPSRVQGTAQVDFDRINQRYGRPTSLLWGYLLQGVHTLGVEGMFSAVNGKGQFVLETVSLDGVVLPQTLVNLLIDYYLKSRFPALALDRPFPLPNSIDRIQVETGSVLVASRATEYL